MVQALIKGEIDFVEDITPLQVEALQDEPGITAQNGISPIFEEIALQHRLGRHRDRQADRRPQPGGAGPEVPARPRLRRRHRADRQDRLPGRGGAGHDDRPVGVPQVALGPRTTRSSPSTSTRPPRSSTRPATRWARTASGRCRTARRSARCGSSPAATRRRRSTPWTSSRSGSASSASTPRSPRWTAARWATRSSTATTTPSSGTGTSSPTRTGSSPTSPATSCGGLNDSWYCDEGYDAMYAQQNEETDQAKRVEIVKQMQQQLYEDAPYIVTADTGDRRGVPQRPVRLLPAAARPGWRLAGPVRRPQLHAAAAGRRRRRLRRRHHAPSARSKSRRQAAATGSTPRRRRWRSMGGVLAGVLVTRWRWSAAGCCSGAGPRPTGSEPARRASVVASAPTQPVARRAQLRPLRRWRRSSAPLGSLVFVLVVNFFLFRVLPGDPARTLGRGRLKSPQDLADVPRTSTASTSRCPSSS